MNIDSLAGTETPEELYDAALDLVITAARENFHDGIEKYGHAWIECVSGVGLG